MPPIWAAGPILDKFLCPYGRWEGMEQIGNKIIYGEVLLGTGNEGRIAYKEKL